MRSLNIYYINVQGCQKTKNKKKHINKLFNSYVKIKKKNLKYFLFHTIIQFFEFDFYLNLFEFHIGKFGNPTIVCIFQSIEFPTLFHFLYYKQAPRNTS